jgi:hypothetical protein
MIPHRPKQMSDLRRMDVLFTLMDGSTIAGFSICLRMAGGRTPRFA